MLTYKDAWRIQNNRLTDIIQLCGGNSPLLAVLSFYLTFRCNYQCVMCSAEEQIKTVGADCDIDLIIEKLERTKFFPLKPFIKITGGEPLLHPDFLTFVRYLKKKGFRCSVNTNGFFISKYVRDLLDLKVDVVNITMLGPEGIYESISKRPGSYRVVQENVRKLAAAKKAMRTQRPKIIINVPINEKNYLHINQTIDTVRDVDIQGVTVQHLMFSTHTPNGVQNIDKEKLFVEISRVARRKERFPIRFFPDIQAKDLRGYYSDLEYSFTRNTCIMPWLMMSVAPNNQLNPCLYVQTKVGNLKEGETFLDFWNAAAFKGFRKVIKEKGVLPACRRCCIRKY